MIAFKKVGENSAKLTLFKDKIQKKHRITKIAKTHIVIQNKTFTVKVKITNRIKLTIKNQKVKLRSLEGDWLMQIVLMSLTWKVQLKVKGDNIRLESQPWRKLLFVTTWLRMIISNNTRAIR